MKNSIGFNIAHFLCSAAFHFYYNIKVEGRENLPEKESFICAPNHRSYADPPLVNVCIKRRFCFIAKQSLFKNPLFAWLIKSLGAVPSTSDDPEYDIVSAASYQMNDNGKCLCIFPEGTRHKDGKVGRLHSGVVLMAAKSGKPVVPIGISFGEKLHFRSRIIFRIGKPVYAGDYGCSEDSSARQLRPMKDEIQRQIKELAVKIPDREK